MRRSTRLGAVRLRSRARSTVELEAGLPEALRPPRSARWDATKILLHVRDPLYRRRTSYNGAEYDAPHLIPEVVPAAVVAAVDVLLASRRGALRRECGAARRSATSHTCIPGRLRCAGCGTSHGRPYPRQGVLGPTPGPRVLVGLRGQPCWVGSCAVQASTCPSRALPALLGPGGCGRRSQPRGSGRTACSQCTPEEAAAGPGEAAPAQGSAAPRPRRRRRPAACPAAWKSYAAGLLTDRAALERRLVALSARPAGVQRGVAGAPRGAGRGPPARSGGGSRRRGGCGPGSRRSGCKTGGCRATRTRPNSSRTSA